MTCSVDGFRKSKRWRAFVELLRLERAEADGTVTCAHCGRPIVAKYDCIGHHRVELTEENVVDARVSLNPDLVDLVHMKCHNEIHDRWQGGNPYAKGGRRVYLVWGSPCSGKTTWVLESSSPGDLVVDVDRIFAAIGAGSPYEKPGELLPSALAVRDALIDHVMTRGGRWRRAWVIGGYPLLMERRRLCDALGAEPVFVECPRAICEDRAASRPPQWLGAVSEWWDRFQPDPPAAEAGDSAGDCKGDPVSRTERFPEVFGKDDATPQKTRGNRR
ncbi:hypothetical protein [Raoultibacter timonensis]|uniref:hypothetical protein n=1 Tax=Raoultibacter timonensis TaxID=1907662 RepID=UPI0026DB8E9F|nr:hypothetical protein [Raoultibacter timonensis]